MDDKIARLIKKHYPEIANGWHTPIWCRLTKINESPNDGDLSDPFRPRYCASVKVLTKQGREAKIPEMHNIAIAGSLSMNGGFLHLPEIGAIVTVCFAFGMPDKPYIDKVMPYGLTLPGIKPGEAIMQSRQGVSIRLDDAGNINLNTDSAINESSRAHNQKTGHSITKRLSRKTKTQTHSEHEVGGTYSLEALGALLLLTLGHGELSALESLTLTTGTDLNENIAGKRQSVIDELLSFVINKAGHLTLNKSGFDVLVKKGSVRIGNESVDVVETLHKLIECVSQLANAVASHSHSHNHSSPLGQTSLPVNGAVISGQGSQADALAGELKHILS
ncbi:hypothetical protein HWQ46_25420 [Shewanella sp. D64]|uniref:hypothetical protein n=1 Tax=unclassified Shewanella TaxID=196818 RepID=UPI0022BA3311|nr:MULTISPECIES: hypothetical protein [unclassified Shewanella]MEC4728859.1 hypothetical protein [Shewanella sp. D64]MEC4740733.1 hypothetical protein [Shewanella sp. E94]WBJ95308.1 hypothetical protein HWQ47_26565 [Shewanella sp. MTB7]